MQRVPIVVSWYFHPLLFFTIIASDMRMPFVTSKRDCLCARVRMFFLSFRFSGTSAAPRTCNPALIKNERQFFSYYVNGLCSRVNVIVSFLAFISRRNVLTNCYTFSNRMINERDNKQREIRTQNEIKEHCISNQKALFQKIT